MNIMSPKWWLSTFTSAFIVMIFIFMIKKGLNTVRIPVISDIAEGV